MNDTSKLSKKERKELAKQERANLHAKESIKKYVVYGVVVLVILAVGYVWWNNRLDVPQELVIRDPGEIHQVDVVKGDPNAPVVLTEYSDFQCPACAAYYPMIMEMTEVFGDDLAFVYRHLPLKQIHFQAELAAQAAEAAGKQDMFWEMHDMLFDRQAEWSNNRGARNLFAQYAQDLGLDADRFARDMSSQEVRSKVEADYLNALSLRLDSTPTFFLQGERIANPASPDEFEALIAQALEDTTTSVDNMEHEFDQDGETLDQDE